MRLDLCLVVRVHELDTVAVGEAVELGVEAAALVEDRLVGLEVHHDRQAALVGDGEVEDAQLDRHCRRLAVGRDDELALVDTGRPIAAHVDLDPQRLPEPRRDRQREAAAAGRAFSGTSCTGFQPVVSRGAAGLPGFQAQSAWLSAVTFM